MINKLTTHRAVEEKSPRGIILDSLIQGFLVLLPLTIILILLSIVFNFIIRIVAPLSSALDRGAEDPHWLIHLLSLAIFCVFVFLIGLLVRNRVGKTYFKIFEKKYLTRIPLYSLVQQTIYQFVGMKKLPFSEVVLIDPFRSGSMMTGFITDQVDDKLYTVFVPTAPNPTNGNIYHVPKELITFLSVTTQDAMRTVMGMGTGTAEMLNGLDISKLGSQVEEQETIQSDPFDSSFNASFPRSD